MFTTRYRGCTLRKLLLYGVLLILLSFFLLHDPRTSLVAHYVYTNSFEKEFVKASDFKPSSRGGMGPLDLQKKPLKALLRDQPVFVHILAYQRTASSVISKMLGNLPGQFFLYEPLDMTFTAMYGTDPGWNVPSDIFNTPQGIVRQPTEDELRAIEWTMKTAFQCQMGTSWPMSYLMHPFWYYRGNNALLQYPKCLGSPRKWRTCTAMLKGLCRGRFDSTSPRLAKCKEALWHNGSFTSDVSAEHEEYLQAIFSAKQIQSFKEYFQCLHTMEPTARRCANQWLDSPCKKANIRIIKTVRATIDVQDTFLEKFPNYRLMHLFRDPRGVAKSRINVTWSKGKYEGHNITRVAQAYCQNVLSDYRGRRKLEQSYPGQIMQVLSDDFMVHPTEYVEKVSELIGTEENTSFLVLLKKLNETGIEGPNGSLDSDHISSIWDENPLPYEKRTFKGQEPKPKEVGESRLSTWQTALTLQQVKAIEDACWDFYQEVKYDWPL